MILACAPVLGLHITLFVTGIFVIVSNIWFDTARSFASLQSEDLRCALLQLLFFAEHGHCNQKISIACLMWVMQFA